MGKNKEQKEKEQEPKSNPIVTNIIQLLFELIKRVLSEVEINRSNKQTVNLTEKIDTLKGMINRLQDKTEAYHQEIEKLKYRVLIGNILFIIILATLILQLILGS